MRAAFRKSFFEASPLIELLKLNQFHTRINLKANLWTTTVQLLNAHKLNSQET